MDAMIERLGELLGLLEIRSAKRPPQKKKRKP